MKPGIIVIVVGVSMFVAGLVMFYSIELGQKDSVLIVEWVLL